MARRFISIWFSHLTTDWFAIRKPDLKKQPFVFALPDHGRMVITAANHLAEAEMVTRGMAVADARAILPSLAVFDDQPERANRLLLALAAWAIRYTPIAAIDPPDGLVLDVSGCAHLWKGEQAYLTDITMRLTTAGYDVRAAIADTVGAAWAVARYGKSNPIIDSGKQAAALFSLPPAALRLPPEILDRLHKLGLYQLAYFTGLPRTALRRRFGPLLLLRIDQALGREEETIEPVEPIVPYQERLPCPEPIVTATGIEIALQRLLEKICARLRGDEKGLRTALLKAYRLDGKIEMITISTNRPSFNTKHLFSLFEPKIAGIEPDLGIELFVLDAAAIEEVSAGQQKLWAGACGLADAGLAELLDRLANRLGNNAIHRYLPDEHYWPERSIKTAIALTENATTPWQAERPRPARLLSIPEPIEVTAPVPDYPPMLFRYKGELHKIKKADGPERIEREWWLEEGPHRDYYHVEDEKGQRYWLFRSGHYTADKTHQWFMHGFFA